MNKMIYKCSKCLYLFERMGAVDRCPDCGSVNFIEADPEERREYVKLRKQFPANRDVGFGEERP